MPKNRQRRSSLTCPRRSLLWRVAAYMLLLSVFTVGTLSVVSFLIARSYAEQNVLVQLSSLVASKEDLIEERLQSDREHAALLSSRQEVVQMAIKGRPNGLSTIFVQLMDEGVPVVGMTLFSADKRVIGSAGVPTGGVPEMLARTELIPLVEESGWEGHAIIAQVRDSGDVLRGYVVMRYEVKDLLESILSVDILGDSAETLLGRLQEDQLVLLHHRHTEQFKKPLYLGALEEQYEYGSVLARALMSEEGVHEAEDYEGEKVFAAYRYLPALGWGLAVKVDKSQVYAGVFALGATLTMISLALLILAALLSFVIARNVTDPLRRLSRRVSALGPGHWNYRKSVHTGDEVETLDHTAAGLAKRLKGVYENLEEEVRIQTTALRDQYEKDRTILESIEHGIIVVDKKGTVTNLNSAANELIGCSLEACKGQSVTKILRLHSHKRLVSVKQHPVLQCMHKKTTIRSVPEIRWSVLHNENDTLIPVILSVTPIIKGKKTTGAIAVFYDITEERRVDYLKSEFISLASHQLRTPLSTIQWYIELFTSSGEKKLSKGQKEYLREMDIASKRMSKLVDALLHAARLEGQSIKPNYQKIDLKEFMEDMAEEFRSLAKSSKIACNVNIPDKKYPITTDPILLHIVFQNLFSNAVKYTKAGGQVEISLKLKGKKYELIVSDSGIGIPKEDQERIFERLFRANNVRKMDTDGNGLGLYISRMVMDNLGGDIKFSSSEKNGTTFVITLPKK